MHWLVEKEQSACVRSDLCISIALHLLTARAALPQIRVETLIGSQANYEIKIKITIYFYKIMIFYERYSILNLY